MREATAKRRGGGGRGDAIIQTGPLTIHRSQQCDNGKGAAVRKRGPKCARQRPGKFEMRPVPPLFPRTDSLGADVLGLG